MAGSSRHARTASPPLTSTSYSNALTAVQQKLNVVTRLAIEGKSKKGWDGAAIKMYLKISLPLDNITPGATIALFPEENLKILDSQVHPLDNDSSPYNFSSANSPLLHKAARALNLRPRLNASYVSTMDPVSSSVNIPPLDDKYTGHVLVSGYHVSYVLPKEFPRRESESHSRRGTSMIHFMAAVDIWVPFVSRPPQAPYLLSIPIPRCLSNQIKLSIPSPGSPIASSLASLSSADEDAVSWDLTSEPHVTRAQTTRLARSYSYNNFADDESSDASTSAGFSEGYGLRGTFQSADRVRVRWAMPVKPGEVPEAADGRHKVGIKEVESNMTCTVLDNAKGKEIDKTGKGIVMRLNYTASCRNVWFPGVATLLGMDVGLQADDCSISWVPGMDPKWTITGGTGFTGFAIGKPPPVISGRSSPEVAPSIYILPSSPDGRATMNGHFPSRTSSNSSVGSSNSMSLLRAPLPAQSVADYSFEGSPVTTPTGTVSSLASLGPPSSPERMRRKRASSVKDPPVGTDTDVDVDVGVRLPKVPVTVHLNMNELLPPSKNVFEFSISGTVLVTPSPQLRPSSDGEVESGPIAVPTFRVLYTDKESISTLIRNESERQSVHVHNATKDKRDGKTLRNILTKGNQMACGKNAVRIAVRQQPLTVSPPINRNRELSDDSADMSHNRTRMSNGFRSFASTSRMRETSMMSSAKLQPRRDGALMIPSVVVTITQLPDTSNPYNNGYAARLTLPAPSDADSEWLEFGLALPSPEAPVSDSPEVMIRKGANITNGPPRVNIASASVEGVPVRFQANATVKQDATLAGLDLPFEETSGKEWITWVSVHVGHIGGGKVEIVYIVEGPTEPESQEKSKGKGKQKERQNVPFDVLLPSFPLPVGELRVNIELENGFEILTLQTNLTSQRNTSHGRRLLSYALKEFHYPRLAMSISSVSPPSVSRPPLSLKIWKAAQIAAIPIFVLIILSLLTDLRHKTGELHTLRESGRIHSPNTETVINIPATVTVTSTITTVVPHKWWHPSGATMTNELPTISAVPPLEISSTLPPATASLTTATFDMTDTDYHLPTFTPSVSAPAPLNPPPEQHALMRRDVTLLFPWTLHFEIPDIKFPNITIPDGARETVTSVLRHVDAVWQIFRRVLHYPLDPP
ncbi:uncharacterized protein FIBRA_05763 [Fibroporia radiculosa]|uniref:Uncharacterized protein n=1 Tax=Fibroporia radiculosa TaxID=599839 RepID=J4H3P8_9APHY|nr:uncharacterized protein FIBRA_05763 [Fibroporia radiculosa]CCM03619.1 predicted protein [Fibroporia radiculosa]